MFTQFIRRYTGCGAARRNENQNAGTEISMNLDRKDILLYAVTDRSWLRSSSQPGQSSQAQGTAPQHGQSSQVQGTESLYDQAEQALRGGITLLQLREKTLCRRTFLQEAFQIKELCDTYHVPLIINDNVEIAAAVDAAGVHLGQKDMEIGAARAILGPDKIIGISARTVEQAILAERQSADYLGVGAVFPTGTKQDAERITKDRLRDICRSVSIPVAAIGGITAENLTELRGSGIDGIAVASAVFAQDNIEEAVRELRRRTEQILGGTT